jgi:hypothetical protein
MLKRCNLPVAFVVVAALCSGSSAFAADQPKPASAAAAQAPALSAEQASKLATLRRLGAPDAKMTLATGFRPVFKATTVKKEISCGVWQYPPNPSPTAVSPFLFWVNNTGATLPAGVHIEWEVDGTPASCCKGVTGPTTSAWAANPPTPVFFHSNAPMLTPPQFWTRPCKAWVIIP